MVPLQGIGRGFESLNAHMEKKLEEGKSIKNTELVFHRYFDTMTKGEFDKARNAERKRLFPDEEEL